MIMLKYNYVCSLMCQSQSVCNIFKICLFFFLSLFSQMDRKRIFDLFYRFWLKHWVLLERLSFWWFYGRENFNAPGMDSKVQIGSKIFSEHLLIAINGKGSKLKDLTVLRYSSKHEYPAVIYLLRVNNRSTRTRCEIC